ncbi:hypothetical protein BDV11DRAFT_185484 [Aspergillus similis]
MVVFVTDAIRTTVAVMLFVDVLNVKTAKTISNHGIDNVLPVEFCKWLHRALGGTSVC